MLHSVHELREPINVLMEISNTVDQLTVCRVCNHLSGPIDRNFRSFYLYMASWLKSPVAQKAETTDSSLERKKEKFQTKEFPNSGIICNV